MDTKPITGTIEQCLVHFSKAHRFKESDRKICQIRNQICDLLGITYGTGYRWFAKYQAPMGETLLRLRLFLDLQGYRIIERERLSKPIRDLGDCVAMGVLTVLDISEHVGMIVDSVMRILIGGAGTSEEKEAKISTLLQLQREDALAKRQEWKEKIKSLLSPSAPTLEEAEPVEEVPSLKRAITSEEKKQMIESFAYMILALKPIAEWILSEKFSAQDREDLRDFLKNGSSNAVFDVSNLLNRLCSERARRAFVNLNQERTA